MQVGWKPEEKVITDVGYDFSELMEYIADLPECKHEKGEMWDTFFGHNGHLSSRNGFRVVFDFTQDQLEDIEDEYGDTEPVITDLYKLVIQEFGNNATVIIE